MAPLIPLIKRGKVKDLTIKPYQSVVRHNAPRIDGPAEPRNPPENRAPRTLVILKPAPLPPERVRVGEPRNGSAQNALRIDSKRAGEREGRGGGDRRLRTSAVNPRGSRSTILSRPEGPLVRSRSGGCSLGDLGVGGGEDAPAIPHHQLASRAFLFPLVERERASGRGWR